MITEVEISKLSVETVHSFLLECDIHSKEDHKEALIAILYAAGVAIKSEFGDEALTSCLHVLASYFKEVNAAKVLKTPMIFAGTETIQ